MTSLRQSADSDGKPAENHSFQSDCPVGLLGGAPLSDAIMAEVAGHVEHWIAADGGADHALAAGIVPERIIGDMDSLSEAAKTAFAGRLHLIAEQMTTDFDKTLRHIVAPVVLAVGVSGGRMDHSLAALTVLARHPDRPCIIVGSESIVALCPPRIDLGLAVGAPVSLYPLGAATIASSGLRWPTEGLEFAATGMVGTSNEAAAPEIEIAPSGACVLLILARAALPALIHAVTTAPRWPSNSGY